MSSVAACPHSKYRYNESVKQSQVEVKPTQSTNRESREREREREIQQSQLIGDFRVNKQDLGGGGGSQPMLVESSGSLILRSSHRPVFDCLHYAKMERGSLVHFIA